MPKTSYWPDERFHLPGLSHWNLEVRTTIALHLIETYGAVAGKQSQTNDGADRNYLILQTPEELVERCFAIADLFVDTAERRGEVRPALDWEVIAEQSSRYEKKKNDWYSSLRRDE